MLLNHLLSRYPKKDVVYYISGTLLRSKKRHLAATAMQIRGFIFDAILKRD